MIDVVALGELLIDFAAKSTDSAGYPTMAANPGGAPGNFLAALNAYGRKTAFLGKVGNDAFGNLLLGTLNDLDYKLDRARYMLNNEDGKGCAATDTGRLDFSHVSAGSTRKIYFAQGDPVLPSGYVVPEKVEPETPEETADSSLTDEETPQAAPAEDTAPEEIPLTDPARMTANEDENPM